MKFRYSGSVWKIIKLTIKYIGGGAGLIALIVGLAQILASYDAQRRSGAFDTPDISLYLYGRKLNAGEETHVFIGTTPPLDILTFSSLGISVRNTGKRTQNGLSAVVTFPKVIKEEALEQALTAKFSGPSIERYKPVRSASFQPKIAIYSYYVPSLDPNVTITAAEPFLVQATNITETVPIKTKEGIDANVRVSVDISFPISINVVGEHLQSGYYKLSLQSVFGADQSNVIHNTEAVLNKYAIQERERLGFFKYIVALTRNKNQPTLLYIPDKNTITGPDGKSIRMDKDDSATVYEVYNPIAQWRLLFHFH